MNLKNSIRSTRNSLIGTIGEWKASEWLKEQGYVILPKLYPNPDPCAKAAYGDDYDRIKGIMDPLSNDFKRAISREFYIPDIIVRKNGEKKIIFVEVKASTTGKPVFVHEQLMRFKWLDEMGIEKMLIHVPVKVDIEWSVGEPNIIDIE